jgi:hypothetical protein
MSYKKKQIIRLQNQSSGIRFIGTENSPADLSVNPLFTDNGDGTYNLNFGGQVEIIDRTNYAYPKLRIVNFSATSNINAGGDGVFVILINSSGQIVNHQYTDQGSELKADDPSFNTDNHVQLGTVNIDTGLISSIQPVIQYSGNLPNRLRATQRAIAIINSNISPIRIEPNGANLNLDIKTGSSISADFGFPNQEAKAPDFDKISSPVTQAFLVGALRDNTIFTASTDLDVINYESSVGVLTVMTNNRFSNRYLVSFTDFAGYVLGQNQYNDITTAFNASFNAQIPSIAAAGLFTNRITVAKNATALNDPLQALNQIAPRINLE